MGHFLGHHQETIQSFIQRDRLIPDLILFNGGSLKPIIIKERIRSSLRSWFDESDARLPKELDNPHPDLAVAIGAAYYGLVKAGKGVKVGSGSPRSYYLGVSAAESEDGKTQGAQASPADRLAICLVERGLDEGTDIRLTDKQFEVLANQPVSFDVYSSSYRSGDACGQLVAVDDSLRPLPPIQTVIQYGKKGSKKAIPIQLEASYTEMGTLALWCRSRISQHRWKLQFQLRDQATVAEVGESEVFDSALVEASCSKIRSVFSSTADIKAVEKLVKDIAGIVQRPKNQWPLGFIRALADELLSLKDVRRLSPEMEIRWLNLTGFCLRPGVGDALDGQRVKTVWGLFPKGPQFTKNAQVYSEWWIFWRRLAGGLKAGQQRQFVQAVMSILAPKKKGAKHKLPPQQRIELWMAAANMERLLAKDKIQLGQALLKEIKPKKYRPQHFWALSRMGARQLLYGPSDRVVPAKEAERWIKALIRQQWKNIRPVGAAVAQIARRTGDRARDIDGALLKESLDWLGQFEACREDRKYLQEVVPLAQQEESVLFGESLPAGLVLHQG